LIVLAIVACTSPSPPETLPPSTTTPTARNTTDTIPTDESVSADDGTVDSEATTNRGGHLVYGIEADTANAWAPYRASCGASCLLVLGALSDPLFVRDEQGTLVPHLVSSFTSNEDHTEHVFEIRPGIRVHDGTPLDGAAVAFNLDTCRRSALTGALFAGITRIEGRGQSVTITTGAPWGALPELFADRACAFMFSPVWLASLADVPFRDPGAPWFDRDMAGEPADGDPRAPVGLGAFVLERYVPGAGNSVVASRNPDYWRAGAEAGEPGGTSGVLPLLDSVEFVVIADPQVRRRALETGQIQMMHTNGGIGLDGLDAEPLRLLTSVAGSDTVSIMVNLAAGDRPAVDPANGAERVALDPDQRNAGNPLLFLSCRVALSAAIDRVGLVGSGVGADEPASALFPPGSIGHVAELAARSDDARSDDAGAEQRGAWFDLELARSSFDECSSDVGSDQIQFTLDVIDDAVAIATARRVIAQWFDAFGSAVEVSLRSGSSGDVGVRALTGDFDAMLWRDHGGIDPDAEFNRWFSAAAAPVGEPGLNLSRLVDPTVDEELLVLRRSAAPVERRAAAEDLNRELVRLLPEIPLFWPQWSVVHRPSVVGLRWIGAGHHVVSELSCVDGNCN
jgi:peptide/nickel transport system substrate-binding protein